MYIYILYVYIYIYILDVYLYIYIYIERDIGDSYHHGAAHLMMRR